MRSKYVDCHCQMRDLITQQTNITSIVDFDIVMSQLTNDFDVVFSRNSSLETRFSRKQTDSNIDVQ